MDPILACPVPRCGQMVLRPSVGVHLLIKHRWSVTKFERWETNTARVQADASGDGKVAEAPATGSVAE